MRAILAFLLVLAGQNSFGQPDSFRLLPDPGEVSLGGALLVQSLASPAAGSYFAAGYVSLTADGYTERSYVTSFTCSSVSPASKRLSNGIYNVIRDFPGGGFIAAGSRSLLGNEKAYVCRLTASLDTLWTLDVSQSTSDRVYDIFVAPDGSFVAGIVSTLTVSVLRFSPAGALLWQKQIPNGSSNPSGQNAQLLSSGTNVYVGLNESNGSNDDIGIRRLDLTTGDETLHRRFGSSSAHDQIVCMKWKGSEIVVSTNLGSPATRAALVHLNSSNLNISQARVFDAGQGLVGAELLTSTDGYSYIGGSIMQAGISYSIVWQVWADGSAGWRRKLTKYSSVVADMLFEGPSIVVPTSDGLLPGIMMNFVNASTGFVSAGSCEHWDAPSITDGAYPDLVTTTPSIMTLADVTFTMVRGSVLNLYAVVDSSCVNVLMPIELTSFSAICEGARVKLEWTTATEHDNDFYTIERRESDSAWKEVDRVDGAGTSLSELQYEAYDESPLSGISYYRLRQTDFNGQSKLSHMVAVKREEVPFAFPNPAPSGTPVTWKVGEFQVFDVIGRTFVMQANDVVTLPVGEYVFKASTGASSSVVLVTP